VPKTLTARSSVRKTVKQATARASTKRKSTSQREAASRDYKSEAFAAIHSVASDLHAAGLLPKQTMREFDVGRLTAPRMTRVQIKALRKRLGVSQPVFAAHLGTTASTVIQWENGMKRPSGMGLKLLDIANKRGLEALIP
jgi:putative transcriptional regulator